MISLYNKIIRYLPAFIKSTGKKLIGTISISSAGPFETVSIIGSGTKFTQDLKVDDTLIFWKDDSSNLMVQGKVVSIIDNENAQMQVFSDTVSESELHFSKLANSILQSLLITIDIQIAGLIGNIRNDFRFGNAARKQLAKEWGIYIGKWESTEQINTLLQNITEIHERRGTEGTNMSGVLEDEALGVVGFGILGECDRISKNPQVAGSGGTIIQKDEELSWVLAGNIDYTFDSFGVPTADTTSPVNLAWRYPDFTIPTASHVRGEYSPGSLAVCWLDAVDMYVIIIDNKNETNYSNRQIERIIEKIVPMDIPYMVQFI